MPRFKVPYSVVVTGSLECEASGPAQANIHARRWLSGQGIEVNKLLMEQGVGRIHVHREQIEEVLPESDGDLTYGPGGFTKKEKQ